MFSDSLHFQGLCLSLAMTSGRVCSWEVWMIAAGDCSEFTWRSLQLFCNWFLGFTKLHFHERRLSLVPSVRLPHPPSSLSIHQRSQHLWYTSKWRREFWNAAFWGPLQIRLLASRVLFQCICPRRTTHLSPCLFHQAHCLPSQSQPYPSSRVITSKCQPLLYWLRKIISHCSRFTYILPAISVNFSAYLISCGNFLLAHTCICDLISLTASIAFLSCFFLRFLKSLRSFLIFSMSSSNYRAVVNVQGKQNLSSFIGLRNVS